MKSGHVEVVGDNMAFSCTHIDTHLEAPSGSLRGDRGTWLSHVSRHPVASSALTGVSLACLS